MASRLDIVGKTLLSPLTPEEQDTFFRLLTKMVTELNELSRSPQTVLPSTTKHDVSRKAAGRK